MVEPTVYLGIGFLVAALLGLLFVPLVHNRAVRLMTRRLEAATPHSIAEIRADKDHLRAEFTMSTRRLEMSSEQLTTEMTTQLAELGRKTDAINRLTKELGQNTATRCDGRACRVLRYRNPNLYSSLLTSMRPSRTLLRRGAAARRFAYRGHLPSHRFRRTIFSL